MTKPAAAGRVALIDAAYDGLCTARRTQDPAAIREAEEVLDAVVLSSSGAEIAAWSAARPPGRPGGVSDGTLFEPEDTDA